MHNLSREAGIPCLTWGDPCPCCSITLNASKGRCTPFLCPGVGSTSLLRCAMRLLICNRSTSAMGTCFPMALLRHRMCLVVLVDETHQRQSTAGREAPSCRGTADSRASEQDNSFATPSRHGGSRYAPRGSFDHRANPPMAVVGARISTPNLSELQAEVGRPATRTRSM